MAEISRKEIELLFTEQVLEQHGVYLLSLFRQKLAEKNLRITGELAESINFETFKQFGTDRGLKVYFMDYGRFIEIQKFKRISKMDTNTNVALFGAKSNSLKKKKDTSWYSKNAYGSLNRLISILQNELSDMEIERIKNIIRNQTIA